MTTSKTGAKLAFFRMQCRNFRKIRNHINQLFLQVLDTKFDTWTLERSAIRLIKSIVLISRVFFN